MEFTTRRKWFQCTLAAGQLSTFLLFEPDDLAAQDECTLPKPPAATQYTPQEPKVVERISAAELADASRSAQLAQFRGAFKAVQDLPHDDVIGWTKQIAQHCINCARSNKNNIHYNWQFPTWHRALLYFLERTMRKAPGIPGGDDFRLVYWDWENPASRTLPSIYGLQGQSLYWGNRGDLSGPNWPLTDDLVDVQPLLAVPSFSDFGGTAKQRNPTPAVYTGPHAMVHNNFDTGDMADLQYSPRDPLFYAHHANIDRLWSSWAAAGHANPDFGSAKVYFYDETRKWRYILMNDLKDETRLGYKYSTLMKPAAPVRNLRTMTLTSSKAGSFALRAPELTAVRNQPETARYLMLRNVLNLETFPPEIFRYAVFTAAPVPGQKASAEPGYVGQFARVPSEGHNHAAPLSAAINLRGKGAALLNDTLNLLVAPVDKAGNVAGNGIPLAAGSVYIVG